MHVCTPSCTPPARSVHNATHVSRIHKLITPAPRRLHSVATRTTLALLGVVTAVMSMVAGYGLALLMGQPFTTLSQVRRRGHVWCPCWRW